MNVRHIDSLHKAMTDGGFHQLDLTVGVTRLKLVRLPETIQPDSCENSALQVATGADSAKSSDAPLVSAITIVQVISERVGIFTYGKRKPLEIGTPVKRGEILGTIKGISIQDHILAPVAGIITAVFVTEGEIVEFGRRLFSIEKEPLRESPVE
ncbi:MAG: hypothetical protein WA705_09475 [Candidatus Ozemobacteraceae bacterium]